MPLQVWALLFVLIAVPQQDVQEVALDGGHVACYTLDEWRELQQSSNAEPEARYTRSLRAKVMDGRCWISRRGMRVYVKPTSTKGMVKVRDANLGPQQTKRRRPLPWWWISSDAILEDDG